MKILITGSSGMLGTDLAKVLSLDFEVYSMSRHAVEKGERLDTPIEMDLANTELLREKILEIKPDIVFHAAAFTKVDLCEDKNWKDIAKKQNTDIVERLIEICNEVNAFLIFFSTDYVFSGQKKEPYVEEDPIEPVNYYGQTKAWAEEALRAKSNRFMIFRVTWLFGEKGNHFPKAILNQANKKNELVVVNDQWGRPTWTRDIAFVFWELLTSRKNLLDQYNKETFHIGSMGEVNWSVYARHVLNQKGLQKTKIKEISSANIQRAAKRPSNSVLNLNKAQKLLGMQLRPWQEAVDEFLKGLQVEEWLSD